MDVLGSLSEEYFLSNFQLVETEPYSDKFDSFDFGSQCWVYLSGSFIVFQFGFVVLIIVYKIVNILCVRFHQYKLARQLGQKVWMKNYKFTLV
jgi:hypothetical protein